MVLLITNLMFQKGQTSTECKVDFERELNLEYDISDDTVMFGVVDSMFLATADKEKFITIKFQDENMLHTGHIQIHGYEEIIS